MVNETIHSVSAKPLRGSKINYSCDCLITSSYRKNKAYKKTQALKSENMDSSPVLI